ncbi:ChuX/HutX family heme-like substrate-binding protein [Herbaspirillum autotrophicum]|uniref:ChuX/HutX family heme-like substrate-binding protein n=1 Tax=Herbaspirillum autotrophicum TaxID=180195 RepID=UPI0009FB1EFB|nr:ChuX/HutX family heme-like substrate-binding protein [Herbaspirillum autotrophicum]
MNTTNSNAAVAESLLPEIPVCWRNPTDAQQLAAQPNAIRLQGPFAPLLQRLNEVGNVTDLTCNHSASLEKHNVSGDIYHPHLSDTDNESAEAVHLRIFYPQWQYGFALLDDANCDGPPQYSFQFFDHRGEMMHKILMHDSSDLDAFRRLAGDFASPDQSSPLQLASGTAQADGIDNTIDINALRADWAHAHSPDDFLQQQEQFDQQRLRKLRLAGKAFAYQVANDSARIILQRMAEFGTSVMSQVGNAGIVQAYYGKIKNIRSRDSLMGIMNSGFRMQLREDHIDSVWVAKKPTTDGIVTSLELFNRQGTRIASFLSKKGSGQPEPREWRDAVMRLLPIFGT